MTTNLAATTPREGVVQVLAEMDKHLSSVEHYEQTADAVLAVLAPELAIAIYAATDLPWDELIVEARNVTSQWLARGAQLDALSGLLRGMARRAIQNRRHGVAISQHALDLSRQIDALTKPNPWFTKADEFPIETAERADRERTSIGYAFPTQEWRQQQLDDRAEVGP